jgi:hypothetical protein
MDQESPAPRRARTSVMLGADLFRMGTAVPSRHRVANISATGLCIAQADAITPQETVVVSVGQVEQAVADVIWVEGGLAGLSFQSPIDLHAARLRRRGTPPPTPAAGWMAELNDSYRRQG